jgi:GT2 family glycosyltransferase
LERLVIDTAAVSVVIPTYGRNRVLLDTLEALLSLSTPPNEIVLADQTLRHDEEAERVLRGWHAGGQVRWLRLPEPSIARAMNQGLLAATGPIVLFLDDDIRPDAGLVEAHAQAHGARPGGLVAGRVLQPWHEGQADPPDREPFRFNALVPRAVDEFIGCNFSLPRDAALALGGFDEQFVRVAYRFEAEFAFRWLHSGRRIRYEPAALIHHLKVPAGGTRSFGEHLTTLRPDHAVGAFYFELKTKRWRALPALLRRLARSVATRHHLRRPWWIPVTFMAEVWGLLWACLLVLRGPRYVGARQTRR